MRLQKDALIRIIEILRLGLTEGRDISQMLRDLDLTPDGEGKLALSHPVGDPSGLG